MIKSTQKTIGINIPLWDALNAWLETGEAKKRGFHSKAQFANFAIGDYLAQYKDHVYTNVEMIKQLHESYVKLAQRFDTQLEFVDKLERFWFKQNFPNIESL